MKLLASLSKYVTYGVGRMIREIGLSFDVHGSKLTKDIAHLEPLSRHRNIMPLYDVQPAISQNAFISPNCTVIGEVLIGSNSNVWYGATLRGDNNGIRIGSFTNIGDLTVIDTALSLPTGVPASVNIGNNVNIEANCTLYSCTIDDDVTVGYKSVILEGAQLERGCAVGPNSVVPPGRLIPAYTYWEGSPAEYVRDLSKEEINANIENTKKALELGGIHNNSLNSLLGSK